MKRLIAIAAVFVAALVVLVVGTGARSDESYKVRAIFDNASFVIPGEDVKVAGVTVGTIQAVQLTPQNKAAVVLQINDAQFLPGRCALRDRARVAAGRAVHPVHPHATPGRGRPPRPAATGPDTALVTDAVGASAA